MKNKIAIIGGSGFIGSHLIKLLHPNYEVVNFDINESLWFPELTQFLDIRDASQCIEQLQGFSTVVLLAAEHADNVTPSSKYYDVNVTGVQHVLDAMDAHQIPNLIFTSSVALYGLNKENPDEDFEIDPFNHYGKSKWQAEQKIQAWHKQSPEQKNVFIIRPTVVFGEGNRGNVFNMMKQIMSGRFMMIGSGNNKKSMSYVGNITEFMHFIIQKDLKGYTVSNYVDKPDMKTKDMVLYINNAMGVTGKKIRIPYWIGLLAGYGFDFLSAITGKKFSVSKIRIQKFCANTQISSKVIDSTGFTRKYTLEEAIQNTVKSIKNGENIYADSHSINH